MESKALTLVKDCVDNLLIDYPELKDKPLSEIPLILRDMIHKGTDLSVEKGVSAPPKKKILKKFFLPCAGDAAPETGCRFPARMVSFLCPHRTEGGTL
mgnify:CR=1 FL=1